MSAAIEEIGEAELGRPTVKPSVFKNSYRNNQCVWVMPTRGMIPLRVHVALRSMGWLPNTPRAHIEAEHMEVAAAYEYLFEQSLTSPACKSMPFVWTYEEDNIQPRDVFYKLFDAIWTCIDCGSPMPSDKDGNPVEPWLCPNGHKGLDAVGGLYRTKTDPSMQMCFGDPKAEGLDFRPMDIDDTDPRVIECNGLAMGSTLWRKSLFDKVSRPWFKTLTGSESEGVGAYTQDLYFCRKAKEELGFGGVRFAVHSGVSVGHLDVVTGEVY